MNFGVQKVNKSNRISFDSVVCLMQYVSDSLLKNFVFEVYDMDSSLPLSQMSATNALNEINLYSDPKQPAKGSNDWQLDSSLSSSVCTDYMCIFTCTVYRPFTTTDKQSDGSLLDVQYQAGETYNGYGGYKNFDSTFSTTV